MKALTMTSKIERLTPEQSAELPVFRARYLDIACGGHRADRAALHDALADAYAVIGKERPLLVIMPSPASAMLAIGALKGMTGDALRDQIWGQLWDQLGGQLRDQLRDQLWGHLWGQLWDQLWGQLRDQLWGQLGDQLWGQLRDQLGDQLRDQLGDQKIANQPVYDPNYLWGSQDLHWIAWARFAQKIGVKLQPETDRRLGIMERIALQCEWWWPYDKIVIASERPLTVKFDDARRLHCEAGPSIRYADDYALWAWHGVRVPREWIEKKAITPSEALTWRNMEQRRAACEILGWNAILKELSARTIDRNDNPEIGELVRVTIPDIGEEQFLRVRCGTGREFALPVPPDMKTAAQANAWTYGFDNPEDYQLEIRT